MDSSDYWEQIAEYDNVTVYTDNAEILQSFNLYLSKDEKLGWSKPKSDTIGPIISLNVHKKSVTQDDLGEILAQISGIKNSKNGTISSILENNPSLVVRMFGDITNNTLIN